ncbi:tumor necrosis factor ligand superfamily member 9 [Mantella aurantiaca]
MTTLPSPVRSEDPESQKTSRRTCRCLDYCLVISMVLLTMVVGSMGALYMALERPHHEKSTSERIQRERLRSSAQLTIDSAEIINKKIQWSTSALDGTFLGQDFSYNPTTQELLVKNDGYYYIYSQMSLTCIYKNNCKEELDVSLSVLTNNQELPILKLNIHIGNFTNSPLSSFSANIRYLSANTKLTVQVETKQDYSSQEIKHWQLDSGTFMGLYFFSEHLPEELKSD